jgi:hypothetical protein
MHYAIWVLSSNSLFILVVCAYSDNESRLWHIDLLKKSFLFSSVQMLELCDITPSIKTKLAIIGHIGPRLMDPKAKHDAVMDLFQYAEQKQEAEAVLKARAQTLHAASSPAGGPGGGIMMGGRGGRGRGAMAMGRGAGRGRVVSSAPVITEDVNETTRDSLDMPPPSPRVPSPVIRAPSPVIASNPERRKSKSMLEAQEAGFEPSASVQGLGASSVRASAPAGPGPGAGAGTDRGDPPPAPAVISERGDSGKALLPDKFSPSQQEKTLQSLDASDHDHDHEFDEELKQKSEERQRAAAVRRSSKIDGWMQDMQGKGSSDVPVERAEGSAKPPIAPSVEPSSVEDGFESEDDDDVRKRIMKTKVKRLSLVPLGLDSKYTIHTC